MMIINYLQNPDSPDRSVEATVVPHLGDGGHLGLCLHLKLEVLVLEVDSLEVCIG